MTRHRQFTAVLKAQAVLELLSWSKSRVEFCCEPQLASAVLACWRAYFLSRAESLFNSPDRHDHQETTRIAALEPMVGHLMLANDILNKATTILHQQAKRRGR